jgi:O-methyltransferase domain
MTDDGPDGDREALDLLIRGFQISRMLRLAADLGLADKLPRDGIRQVRELATACSVHAVPLLRVLRALAAFGVFRIGASGTVSHSARSLLLRTDEPNSLHYGARFWTAPGSWNAWGFLDAALVGENPHQLAWNRGRFQYLREHPDEARSFDAFMANFPDRRHQTLAASFDFSSAKLITDVGGGNGEALRQILARFPDPRGLVFDREDVVAAITPEARSQGRIDIQGGSFFDCVPEGADIYLLVRVLHDWSDDDCIRILRNCRAAMNLDARLLIVEQILEPDPNIGRPSGYLVDTQMMAMFGSARERTEPEFRELLGSSGFALERAIETASPVWIMEARAAKEDPRAS